jgi:hypothetical protein
MSTKPAVCVLPVVLAFLLAGCAITVSAPEGGSGSTEGLGRHVAGIGDPWPIRVGDLRMNDVSGAYAISASVTNTNGSKICWVKLTFEFLNSAGSVVGTCDEYVVTDECMSAGQRLTVDRWCTDFAGATKVRVGQVNWRER